MGGQQRPSPPSPPKKERKSKLQISKEVSIPFTTILRDFQGENVLQEASESQGQSINQPLD